MSMVLLALAALLSTPAQAALPTPVLKLPTTTIYTVVPVPAMPALSLPSVTVPLIQPLSFPGSQSPLITPMRFPGVPSPLPLPTPARVLPVVEAEAVLRDPGFGREPIRTQVYAIEKIFDGRKESARDAVFPLGKIL